MISLSNLVSYLDTLLQPQLFKDYCPNGLQVEGNPAVRTLVTGVTASQALIEAAAMKKADAILVHHGFFWKNENPCLVGMKFKRIKSLITSDMSLLAYHLPLDAHPLYGNNIQLGQHLGLHSIETFEVEPGLKLGYKGKLNPPLRGQALAQLMSKTLSREPLYIPGNHELVESIAWCTGAAQDYIEKALEQKVDAFITGEISERTFHIAQENNLHVYAAGHHATERYGVQALGNHLSEKFGLIHHFIDITNPV